MLSLSQTSGSAVLALSCLVDQEQWVLSTAISQRTGIPGPFLSQILFKLRGAGLIQAKRGYRGGFRLLRPGKSVSILEIIETIDGVDFLGGCMLGREVCSDQRACPTHEFWKAEKVRIRSCLSRISLADVAKFEAARGVLAAGGKKFQFRSEAASPSPTKRRNGRPRSKRRKRATK